MYMYVHVHVPVNSFDVIIIIIIIIITLIEGQLNSFIVCTKDLISGIYSVSNEITTGIDNGVDITLLLQITEAIGDKKWLEQSFHNSYCIIRTYTECYPDVCIIIGICCCCCYCYMLCFNRSVDHKMKFLTDTNILELSADWISAILLNTDYNVSYEVC